jgi:glycosyltransferase involved in cell wall biosynthesis
VQDYADIEYIVIDGASTDGSMAIINRYRDRIAVLVSEKDKGMYDALNKGIALASGDIIGCLHADDILADSQVITEVVKVFQSNDSQAVYGDLDYVSPTDIHKIERKWRSREATVKDFTLGWMPAHPTLYIKANCFKLYGNYSIDIGSTADYELILRFFYQNSLAMKYLPKLMVKMRSGGMSNASLKHRIDGFFGDLRALKMNKVPHPHLVILLKKSQKIVQFFR